MGKINDKDYQIILNAVLKCAITCYFKGVRNIEPATEAIKAEYLDCTAELYKILVGELNSDEC